MRKEHVLREKWVRPLVKEMGKCHYVNDSDTQRFAFIAVKPLFCATLHRRTVGELCQPELTFRHLGKWMALNET